MQCSSQWGYFNQRASVVPGDEERHYFIVLRLEGLLPNIYLVGLIDVDPCVALDGRHEAVILTTTEKVIMGSALLVEVVVWKPPLCDVLRTNKPMAAFLAVCGQKRRMHIALDQAIGQCSHAGVEAGRQLSHSSHVESLEVTDRVLEHEAGHQQFRCKTVGGGLSGEAFQFEPRFP